MFQFQSSQGDMLHGFYITPNNMEAGKKYPTVLYVYGGPHVSIIVRYAIAGWSCSVNIFTQRKTKNDPEF